jgi:putative ABC transport system permease protein
MVALHVNSARRSLFWRLWWRATLVKRPQAGLAVGSLLVAASITSLLLNLYGDVRRKMAQEFRAYGCNVVLAPALPRAGTDPGTTGGGVVMDEASLRPLLAFEQRMPGLEAAPVLYGIVRLEPVSRWVTDPRLPDFVNVVAAGTDFAALRRMYSSWRSSGMDSQSTLTPGMCVLGAHLAARLRLKVGDSVKLEPLVGSIEARHGSTALTAPEASTFPAGAGLPERSRRERSRRDGAPPLTSTWRIAGVLSTGASQDEQVIVPLRELQSSLGMEGKLSVVELAVPGDTAEVERAMHELAAILPGVEVRPIRQIVYSEGKVLGTIRWLLLSLTALILVIIAICVMATMTAIVLERRKDIGVMKALGAGDSVVMRLFLAEGASLGLLGGLAGFSLGVLLARGLAQRLFGVALRTSWWTLPAVCSLTTLIAVVATLFPIRIVRGIQPSVVLKGE